MEIKDIIDALGLDFSNPETKRGAMDAIEAILSSRAPDLGGTGGDGGGEMDVELDPDLILPSVKKAPSMPDDDIEIEDEEKILDQIKHNESEDKIENNTSGTENSSDEEADDSSESDDSTSDAADNEVENSEDETEDSEGTSGSVNSNDSEEEGEEELDSDDEDADEVEVDSEEADYDDEEDTDETDKESETGDTGNGEETEAEIDDEETDAEEDDEFEFDEDDLLDDEIADSLEDQEKTTKLDSRKIKRDRTLAAAKKALADAQSKNVAASLIRELESAIAALEALTEAVAKNISDISDDEFNQLVNRVFDAIDAVGGSDLTYTTDEERELRAQEIKTDLSKAETQNELSAEDVEQIRAETQAIKAREKEADKYKAKSAGSFKGFQEFLSSLYRAIALQVKTNEIRDDSWSAINRRYNGTGVLKQGQRVQELPDKKIPIIDFYFDQSTSWSTEDIKVGMKAVSQLADMEEKGQIKLNIFYFADEVSTTPTRGGTSGWNEIVKNVIATQATNVVIMTDSDMENWWTGPKALSYTVPGYVWYLWKNGINAPRLPRDLKGRGGVQQFSFNTSDI